MGNTFELRPCKYCNLFGLSAKQTGPRTHENKLLGLDKGSKFSQKFKDFSCFFVGNILKNM